MPDIPFDLPFDLKNDKVRDILFDVTEKIIQPYFQSQSNVATQKTSPSDIQTKADLEAEYLFQKELTRLLPESLFVGEETVHQSPETLDRLKQNDVPVWIVDPVDGTRNFYRGVPCYGIILALSYNQVITHGWIYDIPGNRLACAVRGQGVTLNDQPVDLTTLHRPEKDILKG